VLIKFLLSSSLFQLEALHMKANDRYSTNRQV
jgi:hypothetical protein